MKLIVVLLMAFLSLYGKNIKQDPIQRVDLDNGNSILRIHFNYLNSYQNIQRVRGIDGFYNLDFPLPNKWEILKANGYIQYTPSILLLKDLSSAIVSFNDVVVTQFRIFDNQNSGIKFDIDKTLFYDNNVLTFEAIQHYTYECEDGAHSSLWSDIDLANSYLELLVRPKPIKEQISSIQTDVFDHKQYSVTPLNFVLDKKDDDSLKNFALFSSVASTHLKYRLEEIKASETLDMLNHNVIISTKEKAREMLLGLSESYITDEKPSLSMFFNANTCSAWLNKSDFAKVEPDNDVEIVEKGAFFDKSLYLNKSKVALKDLKIKDSDAVSVAFWFNAKDVKQSILFGFDTYSLMMYDGYVGFNTSNKDLYAAKYNLNKDEWYHVVATFHNGNIDKNSLMINGQSLNLKQVYGNSISDNAKLSGNGYIGSFGASNQFNFHGYIDQFYMFDHSITTISANKLYKYSLKHKNERATESLYLDDKLAHDINVIQNPYSVDKAIIIVAPADDTKKKEAIYALYKNDLNKYKRQGLDIKSVEIPEPAQAYSAKDFVPLDKKVYFKELGYETTFLKGWYPPKINLKFKVYPDNYFDTKDRIDTHLNYVFPTVIHEDSVVNIFLNDIFAKQIDISRSAEESKIDIAANKLFNFDVISEMPAYLIGKGYNELRLDFSLVPLKKGTCEVYNTENLVASVLDDSYFILPKAKKWIELPYMQLIANAQYPYSIYPDLQDTVIYLTNNDNETISSAMNFLFFLTQELGSFPYYLAITSELKEEDKGKNIIVFGTIYDDKLQEISKSTPIVFDKKLMKKDYPYINRFVENQDILNKDRLKKYRFLTSMQETNLVDSSIIMQMARSPYDNDKTVLLFSANNPSCLDKGITSIFKYKNRNNILGDTVIYDYVDEEGVSYNIKDKYILSHLGWFETIALTIGAHPVRYIFAFIILLIIFVWIVKTLLNKFKEEHHKDAE
ncbi:cellulose biosynthesis cyclic di-GMP-binding regulatory protein BcsB [bacterium]|nr:cellulose biosynthesis cyclic di-GMP-binding regulatory protein BcsB [bacterium]MBU1994921.1 cellulose biosynthesis cyclic di-GMP-binding regulatory protein BcsB [bacterium]